MRRFQDPTFGCFFATDDSGGQDPNPAGQDPAGNPHPVTDPPPAPRTYTEEEAKALRDEAAARRRELRDVQAKLKDLEDATKSEAQRLQEKAERATALESEREALTARVEAAEAALAAEVEAQAKVLPKEMLELMPSGSAAEQLGWIRKARTAAEKLKPTGLPPAGGRNPAGGGNGKQEPSKEERQDHAAHVLSRF